MNCKYCGAYVNETDKFCSNCGQANPSYKPDADSVFGSAYSSSKNNTWDSSNSNPFDNKSWGSSNSNPFDNKGWGSSNSNRGWGESSNPFDQTQKAEKKNYNDPPKYWFKAYADFWKRYADFSGCTTRGEYWSLVLINLIIMALISEAFRYVPIYTYSVDLATWTSTISYSLSDLFLNIYSVITFIPFLAVLVRRLHDINKSGVYLLFILIPIVGWIMLLAWLLTSSQPSTYRKG